MNLPHVVTQAEWEAARGKPLVKEKDTTRARDTLAAERRRLPMVLIDKRYVFTPLGGQEEWKDSPAGWPQTPPYT